MTVVSFLRTSLALLTAVALLGVQGCSVLPLYKHPNVAKQAEPVEPVGTYNASLRIPWDYDFTSVSAAQAARCRRFLATGIRPPVGEAEPCHGVARDANFVALALSGGGSRSAGLSAAVMWELNRIGVLEHVDVISAVSGGAQAATLYALMRDAEDARGANAVPDRYVFDPDDPKKSVDVFSRNLTADWTLSFIMQWHLAPYLVTYFDRTDVMADSLADNYYPRGPPLDLNWGMRFRDLNPKRPSLVLSAVDMTLRLGANGVPAGIAGQCFTVSYETIQTQLASDLHELSLAQAVMASGAYPGMFQYLSLKDFSRTTPAGDAVFVHLADGGIRDHLALVPINAMLRRFAEGRSLIGLGPDDIARACEISRGVLTPPRDTHGAPPGAESLIATWGRPVLPQKILVIVVDAARPPRGFEEEDADPRATLGDRIVPVSKVIDSVDATLDDQRALRAIELVELRRYLTGKKATEIGLRRCVREAGGSPEDLAACLIDLSGAGPEGYDRAFGPTCCPIIGLGVHDFTKFADQRFGPFNSDDLDSDEVWGADHVTLECLEDNDYGRGDPRSLYAAMRKMPISLSLSASELATVKRAAHALVDEMLADFCDPQTHLLADVDGIPCTPPPAPRKVGCGN